MSETELQYWKRIADQRAEQWDAASKREDALKEEKDKAFSLIVGKNHEISELTQQLTATKQELADANSEIWSLMDYLRDKS